MMVEQATDEQIVELAGKATVAMAWIAHEEGEVTVHGARFWSDQPAEGRESPTDRGDLSGKVDARRDADTGLSEALREAEQSLLDRGHEAEVPGGMDGERDESEAPV